jgi:hypothetical protein
LQKFSAPVLPGNVLRHGVIENNKIAHGSAKKLLYASHSIIGRVRIGNSLKFMHTIAYAVIDPCTIAQVQFFKLQHARCKSTAI